MGMTSVNQAVIETLSEQIVAAYCEAGLPEGPARGKARARLMDEVAHAIGESVGSRTLAEQGPERVNAVLADWEAQEGRSFGLRLIEIDPGRTVATMG
ncbi:hypothetical protein NS228_21665 [Methylobacterium indicum]|uniref:Uncharacterized protein n=1 Tax=Methylobacterium indicum TaxID=1775910 RepID=A0A0J6TQL7_9HYPH|nr:hypothetical protein [Methylobacterium indicum]KMO11365.1 hypothetical protein QR78_28685 [Methylobacterium indicum]KMO14791.1 hypothetical protein QR79_25310 [Methylobacterium indicum]KTS26889.1 hypothetical protein NS229_18205 [Methylobacterium indicum]KTS32405.1 hypothetical protein NS228_21665 [Methylobacterium indicum]KTS45879.1 hypothetical protein NS230_23050 [Methylobacterium indicum]